MPYRPRRSALYMPGANLRALDKARTLPADCLILDLEDAVAPDAKQEARANVLAAVTAGGYGHRELAVRINGLNTPWWEDDLAAFAGTSLDAIVMPKVETADEVRTVAGRMEQLGYPAGTAIWAMTETPRGVLNVQAVAASHARLTVLVMGTSDLAKELRVPHTPDRIGFLASLSLCVLAARANGLDILDGVHLSLDDEAGLRAVCYQGRELGFDGKTLIHPKQLEAANTVFAPADDDVQRAARVIEAWEDARARGQGVAVLDGRLVENLHVEEARRTLAMAEAIRGAEE